MAWWGKDKQTIAEPGDQAPFPETAYGRRQALPADIKLGWMEIWVGVGRNQAWPWLDVAVRVGTGWDNVLDHHGGFFKRPDFIAFVPKLRDFVEGRLDEVWLRSTGSSMSLKLQRQEPGWYRGEASFDRGHNGITVRFKMWDESLAAAVLAAEATLARIKAGTNWGWVPKLGRPDTKPRAALLEVSQPPSNFPAWESGWGDGEELSFEYEVDGYGWYSGAIVVGEQRGYFGGSSLTDSKGDLIRAALLLLAGKDRVDIMCTSEPGLARIEFETMTLRTAEGPELGVPGPTQTGCVIRIRGIDHFTEAEEEVEFAAIARSPRAVAEAIYQVMLELFKDGAGPWSDAMAALEGALATVPRKAGD